MKPNRLSRRLLVVASVACGWWLVALLPCDSASMVIVFWATVVTRDSGSDPKPVNLSILQTASDFDANR